MLLSGDKFNYLKRVEIEKVSKQFIPYLAEALAFSSKKELTSTSMRNPVDHAHLVIGLKSLKYDLIPGLIEFVMAEEAFLDVLLLFDTKIKGELSIDETVAEFTGGDDYSELAEVLEGAGVNPQYIDALEHGFVEALRFLVDINALKEDSNRKLHLTERGREAVELWRGFLKVGVN